MSSGEREFRERPRCSKKSVVVSQANMTFPILKVRLNPAQTMSDRAPCLERTGAHAPTYLGLITLTLT
eukprot:scaffold18785_cov138-Skeletonema_menzelii.AAC.3